MNVAELIRETDKLSPAERTEFEHKWLSRWHPEYEQRREQIGLKLAEGEAACRRGDFVEATTENLRQILATGLAEAAAQKQRIPPCLG